MSKRTKKKTKEARISAVLLKSRRIFAKAYMETGKVSTLIAQMNFDQLVEEEILSVSKALRILNNPKEMKKWVDIAEKEFLESEQGKSAKLLKNTSFKSAMTAGITSGVVVGTVFCLLSPFVATLIQPTANEILKPSPKIEKAPKPNPIPQQSNITSPP